MHLLSPLDQFFLWIEGRTQPMHVGGLQLFSLPEDAGRGYVGNLARTMHDYGNVQPPFNQRLRFRLGQYAWEEDHAFDLAYHFHHAALPHPGRIRELLALVSSEHSHHLDRQRPLWQCYLIEGLQHRRFALYTKIHHAMMDGISVMRTAERALSPDPERRGLPPIWGNPPSRRPRSGPPSDWLGSLAQLAGQTGRQVATAPAVARALVKTLYQARRHPHYGSLLRAPRSLLNQSITGSRRFAAQSWPMDRFQALRRACDATLNDLILAVCAGALRAYLMDLNALPDRPLVAMVPLSLRRDDSAGGNQVATILGSLATDLADPGQRLREIQASIREGKARFDAMTPEEIFNYTALTLTPTGFNLLTGMAPSWQAFNVVISNVPGPRQPLYWNGARMEGLYPASIVMERLALNITVTSYNGQLSFGLIGCRHTLPSLQRLLDHLEEALRELEVLAGQTAHHR